MKNEENMTEPLSLDIILSEFNEDDKAWVLQDEDSKLYVTIPHPKYPGRQPIHFFMRRMDAEDILTEIVGENERLRKKNIFPVSVNLLQAIRNIGIDANPRNAVGFVVHTPNEVYEYIQERNL